MPDKKHNHWLILVFLALAQFMVVLDSSVVNVALPAIQRNFHMPTSSLQWVITAYTLTFGGFLLLGGRAADLFGRRRMFLSGIFLFSLVSLADGLAPTGGLLIGLRALQGLAGALMSPAALSIVLITYREGHERNTALSVWGAVASGGAAAGVLLGGVMTEYFGWRWNFFINVPVGIIVYLVARQIVPKHESEELHNSLDLAGAISITSAMMLLVYGLVEAPQNGWTAVSSLLYFAISAALVIFFIFNEQRVKYPLMRLSLFKMRNLTGAYLTIFPVIASLFSMFFFVSLYVQDVLHYSPVKTGLSFLVTPVMIAVAATNVPRIIKRYGPKPVMIIGPLFIAAALFLFSKIPVDGHYFSNVLPGMALLGLGGGMSFVAGTITATTGIPGHLSGLASGMLNTTQQIGGSLGLAILSGVAASRVAKVLSQPIPAHFASSKGLSGAYAQVQGFHAAFVVAIFIALAASLIAATVIKNPKASAASVSGSNEPVIVGA